jgi:single-stranded DNA-specific DHH superfamily exonuclease
MELYSEIHMLAPFGEGNREPIICIPNVVIDYIILRAQKHITCTLYNMHTKLIFLKAIIYNANNSKIYDYLMYQYVPGTPISVIIELQRNYWNGRYNLLAIIKDLVC